MKRFWRSSKNLRTGWIVTCALVALYVGAVHLYEGARGINNSKATGLAADQAGPILYWRHVSSGVVGGIAQGKRVTQAGMYLNAAPRAESSLRVKDTLDVSRKLSEGRGHIEQQQADFTVRSKQVETGAVDISLRAEAEARVLGLNWRPLYQMKLALRDGLDGVGNDFSAMTAFVFFLPTVVLWLGTIILFVAIAWKILRWTGRRWLGMKGQREA